MFQFFVILLHHDKTNAIFKKLSDPKQVNCLRLVTFPTIQVSIEVVV